MNRSEHEESFISGKGKLSGDGKPEVVISIDLNCDRLLQLAGDSVFESKKVKEKISQLQKANQDQKGQIEFYQASRVNMIAEVGMLRRVLRRKEVDCLNLSSTVKRQSDQIYLYQKLLLDNK
jgi:hypothetical protein